MRNFNFHIIRAKTVSDIIAADPAIIYNIIKQTYLLHAAKQTVNPPSYFLRLPSQPQGRIIALPVALEGDNPVAGIKWIASNPENIKNNIPRASAVIILNDITTGFPFACIEAAAISAVRTAYSAALAAAYIKQQNKVIKKLGIIGTGLIASNVHQALINTGWRIQTILAYDNQRSHAENFIQQLKTANDTSITVSDSLEDTLKLSDTILFTTTAGTPYITDPALVQHNPLILHLSLRDLAPEILLKANNIVDDIEHINQANTSVHLASQHYPEAQVITQTLGDLLNNQYYLDKNKPLIFSPMGLGSLDIALAYYIFQQALNKNLAISITDFFNY